MSEMKTYKTNTPSIDTLLPGTVLVTLADHESVAADYDNERLAGLQNKELARLKVEVQRLREENELLRGDLYKAGLRSSLDWKGGGGDE